MITADGTRLRGPLRPCDRRNPDPKRQRGTNSSRGLQPARPHGVGTSRAPRYRVPPGRRYDLRAGFRLRFAEQGEVPVEALAAGRETHAQRPAVAPKLHDIHPSFSRLVSRYVLLRHPQLSRQVGLKHSPVGPKGPEPFQEAGVLGREPRFPHPGERNTLDVYTNFVYDGSVRRVP